MAGVVAVICEVNPLHSGHKAILSKARSLAGEDGCVLCVMSGHFVQRGTPAVFDKYTRAEALLSAGADLVLELPYPWSAASTAYFANAAVEIVLSAGAETLCFGSESGDIRRLSIVSEILDSKEFAERAETFGNRRSVGEATLREQILADGWPEISAEIMRTPNDILGIAYISACRDKEITAVAEKRIAGDGYHSASEIRREIQEKTWISAREWVLPETREIYEAAVACEKGPVSEKELENQLFSILRTVGCYLPDSAESGGGLKNRLIDCAQSAASAQEFWKAVATKKYTNARIRRAALFAATGVSEALLKQKPGFTFLLAANQRGRNHLSAIRRKCDLPIFTKPADAKASFGKDCAQWDAHLRAEALYTLCLPIPTESGFFLREAPRMIFEE